MQAVCVILRHTDVNGEFCTRHRQRHLLRAAARSQEPEDTVTLTRSTDGGRTFANHAWTRDAFIPRRDDLLGDYIGVAAPNNKVYGAWAEIAPPATPKEKEAEATATTERRPHTIVRAGVPDFAGAAR